MRPPGEVSDIESVCSASCEPFVVRRAVGTLCSGVSLWLEEGKELVSKARRGFIASSVALAGERVGSSEVKVVKVAFASIHRCSSCTAADEA